MATCGPSDVGTEVLPWVPRLNFLKLGGPDVVKKNQKDYWVKDGQVPVSECE